MASKLQVYMPRKQQLSGSAKRKLKEQREALAVCKKVPKITDWASKVNVNQQPLEAEHATDVDLSLKSKTSKILIEFWKKKRHKSVNYNNNLTYLLALAMAMKYTLNDHKIRHLISVNCIRYLWMCFRKY